MFYKYKKKCTPLPQFSTAVKCPGLKFLNSGHPITIVTVIINYWLLKFAITVKAKNFHGAALLQKWRKTWGRRMVLFYTLSFWVISTKISRHLPRTCVDYFVFPYPKNNVFKNRPGTVREVMQVIIEHCKTKWGNSFTTDRSHIIHTFMKIKISPFFKTDIR
jgi:hypothetical protein